MDSAEFAKKMKREYIKRFPLETIGKMTIEQLYNLIFSISMSCITMQNPNADFDKICEEHGYNGNTEDNR